MIDDDQAMTVEEAAASGDHRALLVAMRTRVARAVNRADCPPRDLAALTRRLQDIAREIETMDARIQEATLEDAEVADEPFDPETEL